MTKYQEYGVRLSIQQAEKILKAGKNKSSVSIRILKKDLRGDHKLLLTKTQINKLEKAQTGLVLNLSSVQLRSYYKTYLNLQKQNDVKTGGILPLLALLPLIFGGLGAAGGIAGGVSSAVSSANAAKAAAAQLAEQVRSNKEIEEQLKKSGSGILSNVAAKIPVVGETLKYYLQKLGFGTKDMIYKGNGLFLAPQGSGLFLDPQGSGLFLDPRPR